MDNHLVVLSRDECMERLRGESIGRVAVTHQALPVILPVNYVLSGASVLFRTEPGGMLARACDNSVVAFEIDCLAADGRSGWSVLVVGFAELLSGSAAVRALETGLSSAAGDGRDQFVAIAAAQVTGRVVHPSHDPIGAAP
jgi:nitroimidazol reductase NimA-like FMN-containing flavoprotein (pyridoxamine 5'-phosphate oxidase superfamily)